MRVLVKDSGLNLELARTLARASHFVGYNCYNDGNMSRHDVAQIGTGFEKDGLIKVNNFYSVVDRADVIVMPDVHSGDEVDYLRRQGHKVFGAGSIAEQLEIDRVFAYSICDDASIPSPNIKVVHGVDDLMVELQHTDHVWVKCSGFREIETFHHIDWRQTQEQYIAPLLQSYGVDPTLVFILCDPIDPAVEIGSDSLVFNGKWPSLKPYGYEDKDTAYVGVFNRFSLPQALQQVNTAISGELNAAVSFVSTEVRVVPSGAGYPVDLTIRAPHPPLAAMLEAIRNIAACVTLQSEELVSRCAYAAVLVGTSGWATEHRCEVTFPDKYNQWVKFQKAYKDGEHTYVLPSPSFTCLCVGIGQTIEQATKGAIMVAEETKGRELSFDFSAFDRIKEQIDKGKNIGIHF